MKKVIYSITKLGKVENTKITGVGYITDEELIIYGLLFKAKFDTIIKKDTSNTLIDVSIFFVIAVFRADSSYPLYAP